MVSLMKDVAKRGLRWLTMTVYSEKPLASWPPLLGRVHDINVPRGVSPNPTPQPLGPANINNLILLLERTRHISGDVAECGVYRGATLVPMAVWSSQHNADKIFHGFDSFKGFAESIVKDQQMGGADIECKRPGGMNETSYELVANKIKSFRLENVRLHKGFFQNTLSEVSAVRFSFVHLDCDTYDSYRECLNFFYPRVNPGGMILLERVQRSAMAWM